MRRSQERGRAAAGHAPHRREDGDGDPELGRSQGPGRVERRSEAATAGAGAGKASPYPTYIPVGSSLKPEYHTEDPRFDDGFESYPASQIKAVTEKPGAGGTINVSQDDPAVSHTVIADDSSSYFALDDGSFDGVIANFTYGEVSTDHYTATIAWGDGATSNGVITATLSPAGLATRHSVSNESRVIDWAPTRSASFCC